LVCVCGGLGSWVWVVCSVVGCLLGVLLAVGVLVCVCRGRGVWGVCVWVCVCVCEREREREYRSCLFV